MVHSAEKGIEQPHNEDGIFAVLHLCGRQYKVAKDDKLLCDKLPYVVGQQIALDKVLLVGTKDYTSVGRPYVTAAKVGGRCHTSDRSS